MAYLLSSGWPWLVGALSIGALLGFLDFSRSGDRAASGSWMILLGLAALAMGFAPSFADFASGQNAAALDPALLAGGAYAAGLPIGGMLTAFAPRADARRAPAPVLLLTHDAKTRAAPAMTMEPDHAEVRAPSAAVAWAPVPLAEPALALAPASLFEPPPPVEAPLIAPEPPPILAAVADAPAPSLQPAPAAAPLPEKKSAPGVKPQTLAGPRAGAPDDLARIKGVGPKSLERLNALGVFHYDQIATWTLDNARWIGATIGAPGRVQRDKWIEQAQALAGAGMEQ